MHVNSHFNDRDFDKVTCLFNGKFYEENVNLNIVTLYKKCTLRIYILLYY